jgi:hypothetical protein
MTAEDEMADGGIHARMNVIREAGLSGDHQVLQRQSPFSEKVVLSSVISRD